MSERNRLVWDSGPGGELVLAELCRDCAGNPDRLVETYGGHGHSAIRVTRAGSAPETTARAMRGIVLRSLLYFLVALAAFVVVTTVASRG
ncbi:MAG TPA: hypothetical protein VFL41_07270 [Gaiellaceae bacterium]|nr:hypothetical protein [Gaiellaceae bacterium]